MRKYAQPGFQLGIFVLITLTVLLWGPDTRAGHLAESLFLEPGVGGKVFGQEDLPALVLRRKPVRLNPITYQSLLSGQAANSLYTFNLFDDVTLTAVLTASDVIAGQRQYSGRIDGEPGSRVLLMVGPDGICANIIAQSRRYEVRSQPDGSHLVSEIRRTGPITAPNRITPTTEEAEVFNLTNNERETNGLTRLNYNELLNQSARSHSEDMAQNNYFSHTGQNGSQPPDRIAAAGYQWTIWAENIAAGNDTAAATVLAWMNSPGHRANILNPDLCDLGVGYAYNASSDYGYYWTQNFGCQSGGGSGGDSSDGGGCFISVLTEPH